MALGAIRRHAASFAAVSVGLVALAGCGSSSSKSTSSATGGSSSSAAAPAVAADSKIAGEVPAAVKSKGALTVAADATYAPNEFVGPDGKSVIGMDVDLATALGSVMGIKLNVVNATFDSIIPGLSAGKYDIGVSSFTDTKVREKTVDFVTYFSSGTAFYTKAQGGTTINGLADLCGKTVAVEKGTTQATDAQGQDKKCRAGGKPGVTTLVFPDQNGANLAISSGRAAVGISDSPVAAYQVKKSGGQFKLVGTVYGTAPYGIAIPKGKGLDKPIQDALAKLIAGGQYKSILAKWGQTAGAITTPQLNGATS